MAVKINRGTSLDVLSLTSLIDVVFLLLIFFLVATRFAEEDRELQVTLPSASEAKPLIAKPTELFVNIDKDGGYFVEGKFLAADEVEHALRRAADNNPLNQSVIIRADKRVQFDYVVTVMNLCNRVGISDYKVTAADENQ
jgi:biopolymer transport protein ExbD